MVDLSQFEPEYTAMVDATDAYKTAANIDPTSASSKSTKQALFSAVEALAVVSGEDLYSS